jgi:hypothetical protein
VNNTTIINFQEISWAHNLDFFDVLFAHLKTDQTSDKAHYPRHIFANPLEALVCPILSLAMYFTSYFNCFEFLFPGKGQKVRFTKALNRSLHETNWK